jgi:Protein of unknown function (DUF2384)
MKTLLVTSPRAKLETKTFRRLVPNKLTGWLIEALPSGSLDQPGNFPDVTLVQLDDDTQSADLKAMIPRLAHLQARARKPSYVVFSFNAEKNANVRMEETFFRAVAKQINLELPTFPNPDRVNVFFSQGSFALATMLSHIRAKLDIDIQIPLQKSRPSPLDRMKEVVRSTEDLRVANGKLSAESIAAVFGVSLSQLAGWLGRTRQALTKTPDADSIQNQLAFFERVARLRAVVPRDGFQKWLRMPNPELDDKTPLNLLAGGEGQVIADLVDDMLTGAPT